MTGGAAKISDKIVELYTDWDVNIEGKDIEFEPHKRALQSWRTSRFEEKEQDSQVDRQTELALNHTKRPEIGEYLRKAWDIYYFRR